MFPKQFIAIFLIFVAVGAAYSQYPQIITRQETPLPVNDSGGKWITSYIDFQSVSSYPTHLEIDDQTDLYNPWRMADSAYYLMDSIDIRSSHSDINSNKPWQYIGQRGDFHTSFWFLIPPHATIRVPFYLKAISAKAPPTDTATIYFSGTTYNDSGGTVHYYSVGGLLRCPAMFSGEFGGWQTTIPPNDSGGRWLRSGIVLQSISPYNLRLQIPFSDQGYSFKFDDDSVFNIVDSLSLYINFNNMVTSDIQKYRDSTKKYDAELYLTLRPHQTIHLPVWIRSIGSTVNDTNTFGISIFSTGPQDKILPFGFDVAMKCVSACSAPYVVYDGRPQNNYYLPVDPSDPYGYAWFLPYPVCSVCQVGSTTIAKYKIVGEYAERFDLPTDTVLVMGKVVVGDTPDLVKFHGAPKILIHDTLVATFSTCYSSTTTRTPLDAYSYVGHGYKINTLPVKLLVDFLGKTSPTPVAVIVNKSDFPIKIQKLVSTDTLDFLVSGPSVIDAHDSDYVIVTFMDRNLYDDTTYPGHFTAISMIVTPLPQDKNFSDSASSFSLGGDVNVYSPKYFSLIPKLKKGIHPAGILFTSSVSSLLGPGTFVTIYSNNDPVAQYFDVPYYDDPHFKIDIGNYIPDGTAMVLPGSIAPDTVRPWQRIQAKTTFSGDSYHNYYTQLHWPRGNDTITIDVVCIGSNAPVFRGVTGTEPLAGLRLWPNPASDFVRLNVHEPETVWIMDELGRVMMKTTVAPESPVLDLRKLPEGFYTIAIPSEHFVSKMQLIRY